MKSHTSCAAADTGRRGAEVWREMVGSCVGRWGPRGSARRRQGPHGSPGRLPGARLHTKSCCLLAITVYRGGTNPRN